MARPKTLDGARKVVIYLGAKTHEMARTLGRGNVSEGVRLAIVMAYSAREQERFDKAIKGRDVLEAVGARRASDIPLKR